MFLVYNLPISAPGVTTLSLQMTFITQKTSPLRYDAEIYKKKLKSRAIQSEDAGHE